MRKHVLIGILIIINVHCGYSQRLSRKEFLQDLEFTYKNLKQSISYKTQQNKHKNAQLKYQEIKNNASDAYYAIDAFEELYSLVDEILDLHNSIFTCNAPYTLKELEDESKLERLLVETEGFYPVYSHDLKDLEEKIRIRHDTVEGIYYFQNRIKIGVVKNESKYMGIVLESKIPSWKKGEVILYIIPNGHNQFRIVSGSIPGKVISQSVDYLKNGTFLGANWTTEPNQQTFYFPDQHIPLYYHSKIDNQTDYLRVGSFQLSQLNNALKFYNSVEEMALSENIIIDIRHNFGGNDKSSNPLLKILENYQGNIILLTNYSTVSNAEQFTIRATKLKHVHVMGDRTRGMITYGINYPPKLTSPSKLFKISFTDLKDNWKDFIPYEGVGILPEKYLNNDENWIDQVLKLLTK